jgi:hypothetical protein
MSRFLWANVPYVLDERAEDPLGHPPYHAGPENIGPDLTAAALDLHGYLLVSLRPK